MAHPQNAPTNLRGAPRDHFRKGNLPSHRREAWKMERGSHGIRTGHMNTHITFNIREL